jgi:hypothetical protein
MFAQRDYAKAIEQYDAAMKILPDGSTERADLLCNKAACYYALNKWVACCWAWQRVHCSCWPASMHKHVLFNTLT